MSRFAILLVGAAALAAAFFSFSATRSDDAPADDEVARLRARLELLERRLDEERTQREALEEAVAGLASDFVVAKAPRVAARPRAPEARAEPQPEVGRRERTRGGAPPQGFDAEQLVAAGFARRDAERYAALLDDVELRRLDLRDRATREGWLRTSQYVEENRALGDELDAARERYGDGFADWALFSSGQPNRLRVGDVIEGSAAAEAGLRAGDVVQRYADSRILSVQELRTLTTTGSAGESTALDVRRGDDTLRLYLPRGPLGVRLEPISQEPERVR